LGDKKINIKLQSLNVDIFLSPSIKPFGANKGENVERSETKGAINHPNVERSETKVAKGQSESE
jgi:hypothetical protein